MKCEKMLCPFSIWCKDSNPRPLEHESSPVTTRPGLFTLICKALNVQNCKIDNVHFLKMEPLPIGKISFKLGKQTENKKIQMASSSHMEPFDG